MSSWLHDDINMMGTSPGFAGMARSPPIFHSNSFSPRLERSFMKDFACCGLVLPSFHDLLAHYERFHATSGDINPRTGTQEAYSHLRFDEDQAQSTGARGANRAQNNQINTQTAEFTSGPDMEVLGDIEMDEQSNAYDLPVQTRTSQPQYGGQQGRYIQNGLTQLDTSTMNANPLQNFQGIRQPQHQSTPSTPVGGISAALWNNPTVSSVNTPTFASNPRHQQFKSTPDSSLPGTPGELDPDLLGDLGSMSMNPQFGAYGDFFGTTGLYINNPATEMVASAPNDSNRAAHERLSNLQYTADSDLAQRIRDEQKKVGLGDTMNVAAGEEPKPFRCPVIGCEKAYKNTNGLKYHKTNGHKRQTLSENGDGTYSILDPDTHQAYPGTEGMEKEKPYKCHHCGKRYKNLNGLKYHKTHVKACESEPKDQIGMSVNVSSPGAIILAPPSS